MQQTTNQMKKERAMCLSKWEAAEANARKFVSESKIQDSPSESEAQVLMLTITRLLRENVGEEAVKAFINLNVEVKHAIFWDGWNKGYDAINRYEAARKSFEVTA